MKTAQLSPQVQIHSTNTYKNALFEKKLSTKNIKLEEIGNKFRKDKKWPKFALIYSIFFNKNNSKLITIRMRDIQKSYNI